MNDAKIRQTDLLLSFADEIREIASRFSSESSRIANETYDTRADGQYMVDRVSSALEMAIRATQDAEYEYSSYVNNSGEDYDPSYASQLKEAIRVARDYEYEVRRDYERIVPLMNSLNTHCAALYSRLSSEGGTVQSLADSASHKILTEHTIISDYNS